MKSDPQKFAQWLTAQNYAEQTVRNTVLLLNRLELDRDTVAPADQAVGTRLVRLLRIAAGGGDAESGVAPETATYASAIAAAIREARRPKGLRGGKRQPKRLREARSVPDDAWPRLLRAIRDEDSPAARVLEVQAMTGLRIGDILRIQVRALRRALDQGTLDLTQKGGRQRVLAIKGAAAERAWQRLGLALEKAKATTTVAGAISVSEDSSSSGAAYKQCARLLHELEDKLGLDRLHTHRLRRTMAVQALRVTGDIPAVQELIGHAPGSPATASYLDEARASDVAKLSKKVAAAFSKERP